MSDYFTDAISGRIYDLVLQPGGKIVVGGYYRIESEEYNFLVPRHSRVVVARFTEAGTLDNTFGDDGTGFFQGSQPGSVSDLAVQPDGKILILIASTLGA
jgi:hypothetical protein